MKDDVGLDAPHFRLVKASQHGAHSSHHLEIYTQECTPGHSHVVISCRDNDPNHPHPDVLADITSEHLVARSTGQPMSNQSSTPQRGIGVPLGAHRDVLAAFQRGLFKFEGGYVVV